jgi:hypothetical protein
MQQVVVAAPSPGDAGHHAWGRLARSRGTIPSPMPPLKTIALLLAALALAGCATRAVEVKPAQANPKDFAAWSCERIDAEADRVQKRAADVAYAVDERAGNNILALGMGVMVFWPALIAMQPPGPEAEELALLKGRYDALLAAAATKGCTGMGVRVPAARAAAMPVAQGDRLVYEVRQYANGGRPAELGLRLLALRRNELEFRLDPADPRVNPVWKQDLAGNVLVAPGAVLQWPYLLRHELELGQVVGGEMALPEDLTARARVRGQVVAVGEQTISGRRFDVAVIELFGEAQRDDRYARLDGVIVVDRASGVLVRLDVRSALPAFAEQRRLVRVEPAR